MSDETIWLTTPLPFDMTEEELRLYGWLRENEAILTVRMTREEFEEKYCFINTHAKPSSPNRGHG